tara:strand:- start:1177 stop:1773 length:597 start_codon:yes stop_codon:yes gene_type:complete
MTSRLIVNQIRHTGASADAITMDSSGNVTFPANATCSGTATGFGGGKLLQCKYAIKNDTSSATGSTHTEISSDFRLTLTPTSASNLIEIEFNVQHGMTGAEVVIFRIYKSSSTDMSSPSFIQTPSSTAHYGDGNATIYTVARFSMYTTIKVLELAGNTNARTYSPFWARTGGTSYLNAYNSSYDYQGTSNITVKELEV